MFGSDLLVAMQQEFYTVYFWLDKNRICFNLLVFKYTKLIGSRQNSKTAWMKRTVIIYVESKK